MIKEISGMLSNDEKQKLDKFYSNVVVAEQNVENVKSIIDILAKNDFTFSKAIDLRVLTIEQQVLAKTIEKYVEAGELNVIKNNISILRYNAEVILRRIQDCQKIGKGYLNEDGTLQNFILNDDEWERVSERIYLKDEFTQVDDFVTIEDVVDVELSEKVADILNQEKISLDFDGLDRYSNLLRSFEGLISHFEKRVPAEEIEKAEFVIRNLVSAKDSGLTDEQIINIALVTMRSWTREDYESLRPMVRVLVGINEETIDAQSFLESSGIKR